MVKSVDSSRRLCSVITNLLQFPINLTFSVMSSEQRLVKKAVILAAGLGTRFLPATKVVPKELLPIGNYPIIHYLLQECKDVGIEEVCIVLRDYGTLTEQYFQKDLDLENHLQEKGKHDLIEKIKDPALGLKLSFVKQNPDYPHGHGAALLSAKSFIDQDNFAFFFCDDLVVGGTVAMKQLVDSWQMNSDLEGVVMSASVAPELISAFSSVKYKEGQDRPGGVKILEDYTEKPKTPEQIFSHDIFIGRAVYTAKILESLERNLLVRHANDGEFSVWDAMFDPSRNYPYGVVATDGKWITTGNPEQMWEAQVEMRKHSN